MDLFTRLAFGIVLLSLVQADLFDQGPQTFNENIDPNALPNIPPGYEMKEVTMYLTPSQVKALEAAHILVRADAIEKSQNTNEKPEEQSFLRDYFQKNNVKQLLDDAYAKILASHDAEQQYNHANIHKYVPQVEEHNQEQDLALTTGLQQQDDISSPPSGFPPDHDLSYAYIHFSAHGQPDTNIQMFYPQPQDFKVPEPSLLQKQQSFDTQTDFDSHQKNKWVPYINNAEDNQNVQEQHEKKLYQQFRRHLLQNPAIKNKRIYRFASKKNRRSREETNDN